MNYLLKIFSTLLAVCFLSSCNDFLETTPKKRVEETFWTVKQDAINALVGAYNPLLSKPNNRDFDHMWQIGDVMSDDANKGGGTNQDQGWLYNFETFNGNVADSEFFLKFWKVVYEGARHTNIVIENVAKMDDEIFVDSPDLKKTIVAEAKFLRAFYYFFGVEIFGENIPLVLESMNTADENASEVPFARPNSKDGEIYAQIEKDLKEAILDLPWKVSEMDLGHATKGAAIGLLSKVNLWQGKWKEAYEYADLLIKEGPYDLSTQYEDIWSCDNEHNKESVWEINYITGRGEPNMGTMQNLFMNPRNTWGYGFNLPTRDLYDAYEFGDPRREATIICWGDTAFTGTPDQVVFRLRLDLASGKYEVIDEDGKVVKSAGKGSPIQMLKKGFDQVGPVGSNLDQMINKKYYLPLRYIPNQNGLTNNQGETNMRYLRMGEIYLIRAEAAYHLANFSQVKNDLKTIRNRAKFNLPEDMPIREKEKILPESVVNNASGQVLLDLVYQERRIELAMEGHRYFDLMRRYILGQKGVLPNEDKRIEDLMNGYLKDERKFKTDNIVPVFTSKYRVMPIPQSEVNKSAGLMEQPVW